MKVGGHIHTHDAHMSELVQGQKEEQQKPEELLCTTRAKLEQESFNKAFEIALNKKASKGKA